MVTRMNGNLRMRNLSLSRGKRLNEGMKEQMRMWLEKEETLKRFTTVLIKVIKVKKQ